MVRAHGRRAGVSKVDDLEFEDASGDTLDADSVSAGEASVTGETLIDIRDATTLTGLSSASWTNVIRGSGIDNRSEINGSDQFVPDKSGYYRIDIITVVSSGGTADDIEMRIQNIDTGSTVRDPIGYEGVDSGEGFPALSFDFIADLNAGDAYEFQLRNEDSSFNNDLVDFVVTREVITN